MKKLFILLLALTLHDVCLSQGLVSPSVEDNSNTDPLQQLNNYKNRQHSEGDTIWLPKKLEQFSWNGDSLEIKPTYNILEYDEQGDLAELIFIETYTNDSLKKYQNHYNTSGQIEYITWFNYDSIAQAWVPDYRNCFEYDEWANISHQLMQNWNLTHQEWRDSLRALLEYIDTVITKQEVHEQFINSEWKRYYGYKNEFITDSNGFLTEIINFEWDAGMEKFRYFEKDTLLLNNDGTYHTLIRQRWDDFNELWYNYEKHSDVEYLNYYGYPSHFQNKGIKHQVDFWVNDIWMPYKKDSIVYLDETLNSSFLYLWLWDGNSEWIHYLSDRYLCYEDGSKRRATRWDYDGQQLALTYDDSITYAYYKGAPWELLRVQLDIPTGTWYPASRVLYSDFVPFVPHGSGTGPEMDRQPVLKIIPNPVKSSVRIESEERLKEIIIFNGQGGMVLQKNLAGHEKSITLHPAGLKPGVYVVSAKTGKGKPLHGKMIVE